MNYKNNCLICGGELIYKDETVKEECYNCKKVFDSNVKCINGHFICDNCHSLSAKELIKQFCIMSKLEDPLEIALKLMENPKVKMHGPEHHFLVPAVLLASYYNIKKDHETKIKKIEEAERRTKHLLGGFCGYYGACAAAVGTGLFISLITDATPLSKEVYKLNNLMTAKSLTRIAELGGPRCCKRNSFLSLIEAVKFLKENFNVEMKINEDLECEFNQLNKECLKEECPYYRNSN